MSKYAHVTNPLSTSKTRMIHTADWPRSSTLSISRVKRGMSVCSVVVRQPPDVSRRPRASRGVSKSAERSTSDAACPVWWN